MTRLLWKELRERWLWALCWAAAILGVSLFGQGQAFCGERELFARPWLWLPITLAVLVGAGGYAGELVGDRATFTFSRPIDWRALLAVKLLFGLLISFGTPLLAALCFRLGSPAEYHHLITPASVLAGVWGVGWLLGAGYLFGLACSVVKPGFAGGMITLTAALLTLLVLLLVLIPSLQMYYANQGEPFLWSFGVAVLCLGAWVGALCAAAPLTRFGLTLGVDARIKRFALTYGVVLLGIGAVGIAVPKGWMEHLLLRWVPATTYISPTGKYALVCYTPNPFGWHVLTEYGEMSSITGQRRMHFIRLADGADVMAIADADVYTMFGPVQWASDECAYYTTWHVENRRQSLLLNIVHLDTRTTNRLTIKIAHRDFASPDGKYLLQVQSLKGLPHAVKCHFTVVDLATARQFDLGDVALDPNWVSSLWWQDQATIGYLDGNGKHKIIAVGNCT